MEARELFEILMREHSQTLLAYIRSSVRDPGLVDDIWQETMIVAWRRLDDFDRSRPFGPWLRGIAARTVMAKLRTHRQLVLVEDMDELDYLSSRFEQVQSLVGDTLDEKLVALRDCVSHLSDDERQCIEGRYQDNLMPAQLSQKLSLQLETVKKRLQRAKQRLQTCIERKLAPTT